MADRLRTYRAKRDFSRTAEPSGDKPGRKRKAKGLRYLIQKHDATRLHYDFRLEHNGVLLSWAVTRGPSLDTHDKRLAVRTEDHPFDYGDFEGTIPMGQYGGGTVMLWDEGTWEPLIDPEAGLAKGELKFNLHGERLKGRYVLVRMRPRPGDRSKHENWLLIKERDEYAREEKTPILERELTSVRTGRTMDEIASGDLEWTRSGAKKKKKDTPPPPKKGEIVIIGGDDKPAKRAASAEIIYPDFRRGERAEKPVAKPEGKPPEFIKPQLATLVDDVPAGEGWVHEIKYDGYRILGAVGGGRPVIYTRRGLDWTDKFPQLAEALAALPCRSALLDGEAAKADAAGHTSFGALQEAIGNRDPGIVCYVFDLLELDGEDLTRLPLTERKARLAALLKQAGDERLVYSDHIEGNGEAMFRHASELGLEGIISKRADAPYAPGRSKDWLKIKCASGQEFVIIGWRKSDVPGRPFSSILLAVHKGGKLTYAGRVGSGFGEAALATLWPEFRKRAVDKPAAEGVPREIRRDATFLKPELVADIAFRGWTSDGVVRQGSFKGLRLDKKASEVVMETPKDVKEVEEEVQAAPARGSRGKTKATAKSAAKPKATSKAKAAPRIAPPSKKSPTPSAVPSSGRRPGFASSTAEPRSKGGTDSGRRRSGGEGKASAATGSKSAAPTIVEHRDGTIEFHGVRVTHPGKLMFAGDSVTKRVLLDYYAGAADHILPHIVGRPLSLVRMPGGAGDRPFFQKHASPGFPSEFKPITIREKTGTDEYLYIEDERGLFASVQMGVVELHIWGSHVESVEQPDRIVFDFDPDEAIGFAPVKEAAVEMRGRLAQLGLESFVMATGGKGLHVVIPLTPHHGWEDTRAFAEAMARMMAADAPDRYLAEMSKAKRKGRIFIDYLRNTRGATAIAPFSPRARKDATLAWPLAWPELKNLPSAQPAKVETALALLKKRRRDPWAGYFDVEQVLPLDRLGHG